MSTKGLEQKLAAALGVSKGRISQLKRQGMPTTSIDAARAWRATRPGSVRRIRPDKLVEVAKRHLSATRPPERDAQLAEADAGPEGALARLREAEIHAYGMLAAAVEKAKTSGKAEDYEVIPGLMRNHGVAATNRLEIERRWQRHLRSQGEVAPVEYLVEVLRRRLDPLAAQLDNLARMVAPQANPQAPDVAERAIAAAVRTILEQCASAQTNPVERAPE